MEDPKPWKSLPRMNIYPPYDELEAAKLVLSCLLRSALLETEAWPKWIISAAVEIMTGKKAPTLTVEQFLFLNGREKLDFNDELYASLNSTPILRPPSFTPSDKNVALPNTFRKISFSPLAGDSSAKTSGINVLKVSETTDGKLNEGFTKRCSVVLKKLPESFFKFKFQKSPSYKENSESIILVESNDDKKGANIFGVLEKRNLRSKFILREGKLSNISKENNAPLERTTAKRKIDVENNTVSELTRKLRKISDNSEGCNNKVSRSSSITSWERSNTLECEYVSQISQIPHTTNIDSLGSDDPIMLFSPKNNGKQMVVINQRSSVLKNPSKMDISTQTSFLGVSVSTQAKVQTTSKWIQVKKKKYSEQSSQTEKVSTNEERQKDVRKSEQSSQTENDKLNQMSQTENPSCEKTSQTVNINSDKTSQTDLTINTDKCSQTERISIHHLNFPLNSSNKGSQTNLISLGRTSSDQSIQTSPSSTSDKAIQAGKRKWKLHSISNLPKRKSVKIRRSSIVENSLVDSDDGEIQIFHGRPLNTSIQVPLIPMEPVEDMGNFISDPRNT